jgi:hypothetical protein
MSERRDLDPFVPPPPLFVSALDFCMLRTTARRVPKLLALPAAAAAAAAAAAGDVAGYVAAVQY